jgi:hypothetical protein
MSPAEGKKSILVHETTLPHLDFIEKIILDELIRQGRATIINDAGTAEG